jgi:hypothetical protein
LGKSVSRRLSGPFAVNIKRLAEELVTDPMTAGMVNLMQIESVLGALGRKVRTLSVERALTLFAGISDQCGRVGGTQTAALAAGAVNGMRSRAEWNRSGGVNLPRIQQPTTQRGQHRIQAT